jgi:hypothetical protein
MDTGGLQCFSPTGERLVMGKLLPDVFRLERDEQGNTPTFGVLNQF